MKKTFKVVVILCLLLVSQMVYFAGEDDIPDLYSVNPIEIPVENSN